MPYQDMIPDSVNTTIDKRDSIADINAEDVDTENPAADVNDPQSIIVEIDTPETEIEIEVHNAFSDNLALVFSQDSLDEIGTDLLTKYEQDKEARQKRDEQYNEGMRRAGLDDEAAPSGADFEGSARVVHPMIAENCVDFASREAKELLPPNGPAKAKIVGDATTEKVEISERKVKFLNLLCTEYSPYRSVFEKMLSQLPLGGSMFIKFWHCEYLRRPTCEFLPIDRVFIPYSCNDFYLAERVSVRMTLSSVEYWRRVESGLYYDQDYTDNQFENYGNANSGEEISKTEQTANIIEGKDAQKPDLDDATDDVDLIEVYAYLMVEEDKLTNGGYAPYIITIKEGSGEVISMYRNWDEKDDKRIKEDYIVKFDFIPWREAYGIGIGQLVGSLSVAATGALRGLLDSAHVNNIPTAVALKGLKMAGQTEDIQVGQITYMEGPASFDGDIKRMIMPLPFNPPSPILFQLLEWLTNASGKLIKMPDGGLEQMGDRTPASTSLAVIEQNSMTQSAIHQRLHFSQAKCLKIYCRLLAKYYDPAGYPTEVIEDLKINQELFSETSDIIPVSDPNIFTAAQRYAQIQMITGLNQSYPGMINQNEALKRTLILAQVPDYELLMNTPNNISRANPAAENMATMLGQAIGVFPEQDHLAHMKVHASWLMSPMFGQNPLYQDKVVNMAKHIQEHLAFLYASAYETLGHEMQNKGIITSQNDNGMYDQELVEVTPTVEEFLQKELAPFQPVLDFVVKVQQQMQQAAAANNPQLAKIEVDKQKIQQQAQISQQDFALQQQKLQSDMQIQQIEAQSNIQISQENANANRIEAQAKNAIAQAEIRMEQDKTIGQLELEKIKMHIEQMKALTAIKTQDRGIELQQMKMMMDFFHKLGALGVDMDKHITSLENDIRMSEISSAENQLAQQQQNAIQSQVNNNQS